jgi:hypothetical protein
MTSTDEIPFSRPFGARRRRLIGASLAWAGSSLASEALAASGTSADIVPLPGAADLTARLLAGMTPDEAQLKTHPWAASLVASPQWRAHHQWIEQQWQPVKARARRMSEFSAARLGNFAACAGGTLLYPFSGPDFLNAHALAGGCRKQVFFSLEKPGSLPALRKLAAPQLERLLQDARNALADLISRNYFITSYMSRQLTTPQFTGVVPVLAMTMVLSGARIVDIEPMARLLPTPDAQRPRGPALQHDAVRILWRDAADGAGAGVRALEYHSLDVSDTQLAWHPGFIKMLEPRPGEQAVGLIKSASYLLHDDQFTQVRKMMLERCEIIVQDDTGIPLRSYERGAWGLRLFGVYSDPLKDLSWGRQPRLREAFERAIRADGASVSLGPMTVSYGGPLDFPFGYRGREGRSNMIMATRPAA